MPRDIGPPSAWPLCTNVHEFQTVVRWVSTFVHGLGQETDGTHLPEAQSFGLRLDAGKMPALPAPVSGAVSLERLGASSPRIRGIDHLRLVR